MTFTRAPHVRATQAVIALSLLAAVPAAAQAGDAARPAASAEPRRPRGGEAASMKRLAGDRQTGLADAPLQEELVVRLRDLDGRPAAGARVEWTVLEGGGRIEPRVSFADSAGLARAAWTLGASADVQRASATVRGLGTVRYTARVPVAEIRLADSLVVATGDTLRLRAELRDARGTPLRGGRIEWRLRGRSTADLLKSGRIAGLRPGTARLEARSGAAAAAATLAVVPAVRGRVVALDGRESAGARIALAAGERAETAVAGEDGRFATRLGPESAAESSFDLIIDDGRELAARVRLSPSELRDERTVLLLPRRWEVRGGTHAGRGVRVDPLAAFEAACDRCSGFYRRSDAVREGAWPDSLFPLPLAFDHRRTDEPIESADSAAFWRAAEALETALGRDLFRPARTADITGEFGRPGILARIEEEMEVDGQGATVSQHGDILHGTVAIRSRGMLHGDAGVYLVAHELVHALGFGHTCAWPSLMADVRRCPSRLARGLTAEDAAYMELYLTVRERERETGAVRSLEAAALGAVGVVAR